MSTLTRHRGATMGAGSGFPTALPALTEYVDLGSSSSSPVTVTAPAARASGNLLVGLAVPQALTPDPPAGYTTVGSTSGFRLAKRTATGTSGDDLVVDPTSAQTLFGGLLLAIATGMATVTAPSSGGGSFNASAGGTTGDLAGVTGAVTAVAPGFEYLMICLAYPQGSSATVTSLVTSDTTWTNVGSGAFTTIQGKSGRYLFLGRRVLAAGLLAAPTDITYVRSDTNTIYGLACRFAVSA